MALDTRKFVERFVDEAREHITKLSEGLVVLSREHSDRATLDSLFRSAHTIKGSARMLRLTLIGERARELEDHLDGLRSGSAMWDESIRELLSRTIDSLAGLVEQAAAGGAVGAAETAPVPALPPAGAPTARPLETVRIRLETLDELLRLTDEIVAVHGGIARRIAELGELRGLRDEMQAQELLIRQLHAKALVLRMLPLSVVFEPLTRMVREIARTLGKETECAVTGAEIELDRQIIDLLYDPLLHLLRNAVDHGIEAPDLRRASGKPARARIALSARQEGPWVLIEVADDGGGIAFDRIRDKAIRKGYRTAEQLATMSRKELIDLIFLPGFSTSPIITELSGRGVGLDVVKKIVVDELRGAVFVESTPAAGTTFTLRLPLSLATMRVLIVGTAGRLFGFTAQHVADLARVDRKSFLDLAGRPVASINGELVPVRSLAALLGLEPKTAERAQEAGVSGALLLIVQEQNERLALVIDDLVDEDDMIIKPLPVHLRRARLVSGMVAIAGELVGILHVPALLELARLARAAAATTLEEPDGTNAPSAPHILIVDDSPNTREIERDVLEAHGYRVTLAEDGADGLRKANDEIFDAVLTDVEMPNLNGLELTERLRRDGRYRDTPILIVTSRAREEDKQRGIEAGADAYILKGDFEQESLVDTLRRLGL